jgi:opacity protein-like surface antigen
MKLIAIAAASVLLMAGAAQAQQARQVGGTYAEIGYTQMKLSGDDVDSLKPGALRGIVGYEFHPNAAVEGMLAFGIRKEERTESMGTPFGVATATMNVKLKNAYGVYLKPKANLSDAFEVFGRVGYTHASFKADATVTIPGVGSQSASDSGSDGGFSYGLGANFKFNPTTYVGVDYMHYYKKDGVTLDGLTVGVGFRF